MTKHLLFAFVSQNEVETSLFCPEKRLDLPFIPNDTPDSVTKTSPFETFKREFQLLWKYRENICNTPELSNIQIPCIGISYAYIGCGPVTLGMLLNLYAQGLLRVGYCKTCGHETLGYYFCGSILSGAGSHRGFCPICGTEDSHNGHGYVHKYFFNYKHPFPVEPTQWTVTTLVTALKKLDLKIN